MLTIPMTTMGCGQRPRAGPLVPIDAALVRLLANMVLRIQAEVQHVY